VDYENIIYEKDGGKARITLNRPEKLNALSRALQQEVSRALWDADNDTDVHVVILRGAGRAFSAGYDLTAGGRTETYANVYRGRTEIDDDAWGLEQAQRERMAIFDMHKPVIAQIHGYCLAGGTDLALLSDMVIAAEDATIGFPPVRAMGGPPAHMWTYLVGPQWAKRLLLTGDSVSGAEAARIGLVLQAVPRDELEATVEALADRLCMIDPHLLSANKRACNLALELMGARTMQRLAAEIDARAHQAPAVKEFGRISREQGLKAALEWRDTKFGDGRAFAGAKSSAASFTSPRPKPGMISDTTNITPKPSMPPVMTSFGVRPGHAQHRAMAITIDGYISRLGSRCRSKSVPTKASSTSEKADTSSAWRASVARTAISTPASSPTRGRYHSRAGARQPSGVLPRVSR
jgi:enoyl-CoA hydratase